MSEYIYRSNGEPLANERGEILLACAGEIVRCRDCKYFECLWIDGYVCTRNKDKFMPWVELDGFCSWGERNVNG